MTTGFRIPHFAGPFLAAFAVVLLLVPEPSPAQTFFGSGSSTNAAPDISNVALGFETLFDNSGVQNTAIGWGALDFNTTGDQNTAIGWGALYSNTMGSYNTASGDNALVLNTTGTYNTAEGVNALYSNSTGDASTATGLNALFFNTTGSNNTADGVGALQSNTTGNNNIALGYTAGINLTTGDDNIDIGNDGLAGEAGIIRIGADGVHTGTYIAGISGVTAGNQVAVYINPAGQLGTFTSSRRFKKDIHNMGQVSDKLMQLRPVTFRYKQATDDGTHPVQYGLIAEEVAKVYPNLVQYDKAGKPFTIYYHLLTPMLLNELQKSHRGAEAQQTALKAAQTKIAMLTASQKAAQAETTSLKAALQAQRSELAALKQSQQQQLAALAKLTALVQSSQNRAPSQTAVYSQH